MINQGNNVPDKTIALFDLTGGQASSLIRKPKKKRDWFTPNFYHCHPLTIANQYGFEIISAYPINLLWNGKNNEEDLEITKIISEEENNTEHIQDFATSFGEGILTVLTDVIPRTPPGVNLLITGPINTILPGITSMTAVVESDNIRTPFTVNLKVNQPNALIHIPKGTPLATMIPIPRYFGDNFELKDSNDLFSQELFLEEVEIAAKQSERRNSKNLGHRHYGESSWDKDYFNGQDFYGNKFPDHQKS
jgi:hypothetical protein